VERERWRGSYPVASCGQSQPDGMGDECKRYDLELSGGTKLMGGKDGTFTFSTEVQLKGLAVECIDRPERPPVEQIIRSALLGCSWHNHEQDLGMFPNLTAETLQAPRWHESPTQIAMRKDSVMNFMMASHSDDKNSILSSLPTSCLKTKVHP
jgi:hypothetical protein